MRKGGVGKSTVCSQLALALESLGQRVLAVDLDPQATLTGQLGISPGAGLPSLVDALLAADFSRSYVKHPSRDLYLIPGDDAFGEEELIRIRDHGPEHVHLLRRALAPLLDYFAFVLIDSMPSINVTTRMVAFAADMVILPTEPTIESLRMLSNTMSHFYTWLQHRPDVDPKTFLRVLLAKVPAREKELLANATEALAKLPTPPFETQISLSAAVPKATARARLVAHWRKSGHEFINLAAEVIAYAQHLAESRAARAAAAQA
jgi:chromosome partitioning protein